MKQINLRLPHEITNVLTTLEKAGFEAYAVGGCVRDLLLERKPKDWDITTNAKPEEIQNIFKDSFYENEFGTVGVKTGSDDASLAVVEITTYRVEGAYTDKRHPDTVTFTTKLEDDLARRDFTINAIALDKEKNIVDPFNGKADIKSKLLKTVGESEKRFEEDALRMMRAVRLAVELDFELDDATAEAVKANAGWLQAIAKERIRDELSRIISHTPHEWLEHQKRRKRKSNEVTEAELARGPARAFELMRTFGLLQIILPELEEGYGVTQNKHHIYTVWEHNLRAFTYAVKENFNWHVRFAALLHDVGKPQTKRGEGPDSTFYGHDVVGAKMTARLMQRLSFGKKDTEKAALLVRYHLFQSDPEKITDYAVRKVVRNVGEENIWDLIDVRLCDRIGSGVPKAEPYRLRKFLVMLERALREPISLKQLKINGDEIMKMLELQPGPRVGHLLNALMGEILEDPKKNEAEYLANRVRELNEKDETELKTLADEARKTMTGIEYKKEEEVKAKYWVE